MAFIDRSMNVKYILGAIICLPLLPLMYYQGRKIRASVPRLPEAKGTIGISEFEGSEKKLRMLMIGESTMAGVGVNTHREGFSGTLASVLSDLWQTNIQWQVFAKSGYTVQRVKDKILPGIPDLQPDLIVIGLGGNDAFALRSPKQWENDINALIEKVRKQFGSIPLVFTNMPPIKEFPAFTRLIKFTIGNLIEMFGQSLAELTRTKDGVYYSSEVITIDSWIKRLKMAKDVKQFFSDGVHPSQLTYQIWARDLAEYINRNVAKDI